MPTARKNTQGNAASTRRSEGGESRRRVRGRSPPAGRAERARRRPVLPYRGGAGAPVHRVPLPRRRQEGGRRAHRRSTPGPHLGHCGVADRQGSGACRARPARADTVAARKVLSTLGVTPRHVRGDRFQAKDRPTVPERTKRKPTMRRAQQRNIRRAPMGKGPRD